MLTFTQVLKATKKPTYSPDVSYLLVGCLGGLGRCFAREMVQQGARHLIFLGRSGDEKPEASAMVRRMRSEGVDVQVIKGDVSKEQDVLRAVKAAKVPIAGVMQGVMALDVSKPPPWLLGPERLIDHFRIVSSPVTTSTAGIMPLIPRLPVPGTSTTPSQISLSTFSS